MASNPPVDALALLGHETRRAVAPHVAARLVRGTAGDAAALAQLAAVLRPEHLAGTALLPDPLPAVPAVRASRGPTQGGAADRRVLLCAAVAVTDRADILLRATGDATEALVAGPVVEDVELADGRFRITDPRMRCVVHDDADLAQRTAAHTALARAARDCGEPGIALWHTALSTLAGDELLADGLVELAELLASHGDTEAAHEVAREAASHGTGDRRARAFLVAGRSALWSGHLVDAQDWLRRADSSGVPAVERDAARCAAAVRALLTGETAERSDADATPGARLARTVEPLVGTAGTRADRAAVAAVAACLGMLENDPAQAEALLVRTVAGVVPARRRPGPWPSASGALAPLAEAAVRAAQALLLLRAGQTGAAATVLDEAVDRLPMAHVGGGLAGEVSRRLDAACPGRPTAVTAALERVGPPRTAPAVAAAAGRWTRPADRGCSLLAAVSSRGCAGGSDDEPDGALPLAWSVVLTARETEVARLVTAGMTNREVANALCVSVRTVEVHLGRVFRKLDVRSRSELVVLALRPVR